MAVFGSILRDDYRPDSDIDFVVTYQPGVRPHFREVLDMEEELATLVGRQVDVVERPQLDAADANPIRRREILKTMEPIYADR
jgi:Predicted nucleotidyltransferases